MNNENDLRAEIDRLKSALEIECTAKNQAYYFILANGLLNDFKEFCQWSNGIDVSDPVTWLNQARIIGDKIIAERRRTEQRAKKAIRAAQRDLKKSRKEIESLQQEEQENKCLIVPFA